MEEQKKIYEENKNFFDKLSLFHNKVEEMKQIKNDFA